MIRDHDVVDVEETGRSAGGPKNARTCQREQSSQQQGFDQRNHLAPPAIQPKRIKPAWLRRAYRRIARTDATAALPAHILGCQCLYPTGADARYSYDRSVERLG
jgi:hypothetical protein